MWCSLAGSLCGRLPAAHVTLLCHLLCVLHHIARRSQHNLMSAANVAVCVGPSLLAPSSPAQALCSDNAAMIAWAGIERFRRGDIGDPDAPARPRWPLDDGAEPVLGSGKAGAKA